MTGKRTLRGFAWLAWPARRRTLARTRQSGRSATRWPQRLALGLLGVLCAADARALEVVGASSARFSWEPASGPVAAYLVYVSRNGQTLPLFPEQFTYEPRADVPGSTGDTVVIAVAALGPGAAVGPLSDLSYPVRFAATPSSPAIGVSTAALFLSATPGFEVPAPWVSVVNTGGGSLDFGVTTFPSWLRATPTSGTSKTGDVRVRFALDTAGLSSGVHYGSVTLRAAGIAAPTVIPVILTVLEPIPSFTLSTRRISIPAIVDQAAQQVLVTLTGSVPGAEYSVNTDADWIRPASAGGTIGSGQEVLSIEIDPAGLGRGTHSGHLYVIASDPRARIVTADVTLTLIDPLAPSRVGPDLNGDGRADLVWRDRASGSVQLWLMSGALRLGYTQIFGPTPATDWILAAMGDLDADRRADLVWQNVRSGQAVAWFMNGLVRVRTATLPRPDTGSLIAAADDVDGDGRADLVLHDAATGSVSVWLMQGSVRTGTVSPDPDGELVASVIGSGDFDATGTADLVWRTAGGGTRIWLSHDGEPGEVIALDAPPEAGWTIAGVADQDGDGKSDLIWRNDLLRETLLWRFESPTLIDSGSVSGMRYPGWSLAAAADFDGDGESDLLWRSVTTGQATLWLMEGFVRRQGASLASPPPASWDVVP